MSVINYSFNIQQSILYQALSYIKFSFKIPIVIQSPSIYLTYKIGGFILYFMQKL